MEHLLGQFLVFFATIDPIGTVAIFVGLTAAVPPEERRGIAIRAVALGGGILVVFAVLGQIVLGSLGVQLASFQLAGAVVFFLFGLQMVFGTGPASGAHSEPGHDIAVFPLAVPSIASPGSILAAVVLTDNRDHTLAEQSLTLVMLVGVLVLTLAGLFLANHIHRMLGQAGASLLIRVFGLVLAALAVQMGVEAITELLVGRPA